MKSLFKKYRLVWRFIVVFLGVYLLLSFFYFLYLKYGHSETYYPEIITHTVALHSQAVIEGFGYEATTVPSPYDDSMLMNLYGKTIVRIVEGCNAMSVMLLFVSFILAFAQKLKETLLFMFAGLALIYTVNIFRIALLTIGIYKWPQHQEVLHQIIFPMIIYGMVFLLWLLWIRKITLNQKSHV